MNVIQLRLFCDIAAELSFVKAARKNHISQPAVSVHIRKLEEAGYINVEKRFQDRRPQTLCHLTDKGRNAWIDYIKQMEALMRPDAAE